VGNSPSADIDVLGLKRVTKNKWWISPNLKQYGDGLVGPMIWGKYVFCYRVTFDDETGAIYDVDIQKENGGILYYWQVDEKSKKSGALTVDSVWSEVDYNGEEAKVTHFLAAYSDDLHTLIMEKAISKVIPGGSLAKLLLKKLVNKAISVTLDRVNRPYALIETDISLVAICRGPGLVYDVELIPKNRSSKGLRMGFTDDLSEQDHLWINMYEGSLRIQLEMSKISSEQIEAMIRARRRWEAYGF
jgi:hypothetical protein